MPKLKTRKRKIPITGLSGTGCASSHPHASRTLIRRFHVLLKQQAQLKASPQNAENTIALADVEREIDGHGGLAAYQRMSSIGQGDDRGGGSEKVLVYWLRDMGMSSRKQNDKLKLLEVGALKPDNYRSCTWIDVTPMDLRSRHPAILEQDFLLMDAESEHSEKWCIITLSLVVNFVPEPKDRGRMLRMAYKMLSPQGLLFLVLPLPCVQNSRYLTFNHLKALMLAIGFVEIKERWKQDGKMSYWLYRKGDSSKQTVENFQKKVVFRQGKRNNFSILL
jgi:25S rRNA (adenine2142-N1)-methyltransferase